MNKTEQKAEAILRMKKLGLFKPTIDKFIKNNHISISETNGVLYNLNEYQKLLVNQFEHKYKALVYHMIRNQTKFGDLLSMIYISNQPDEWEFDQDDLNEGLVYAYVHNLTNPEFSEFGQIKVRPRFGGLERCEFEEYDKQLLF